MRFLELTRGPTGSEIKVELGSGRMASLPWPKDSYAETDVGELRARLRTRLLMAMFRRLAPDVTAATRGAILALLNELEEET